MKTFIHLPLLAILGLAAFAAIATAQQMPQDNWRYDGLQFASPDSNNYLLSIGTGPAWQNANRLQELQGQIELRP